MAGRKPKPTAVKKLEGNPGKRKLNTKEPIPAKGMPDCPDWLMPEAKKEWERLAELMNQMGVLTEVDMAAFAAYCQSYARWKEAQEHITSGVFFASTFWRKLQNIFGECCISKLENIAKPGRQLLCQPHSHCRQYLIVTA